MQMIHLVDVEQRTETQDPVTGAVTATWSALYSDVFCDISPLSVKDFIQSRAHQSEATVRVTIGYLTGINATMRLVGKCGCHLGKIYNPEGMLEDDRTGQEWITLPCSEGVNAG